MTVVPEAEIDVRLGRPAAPERLYEKEGQLWEKLTLNRRPGWFAGAEAIFESQVTGVLQVRQLEAALRKTKPNTCAYYERLSGLHRQSVAMAATLAQRGHT